MIVSVLLVASCKTNPIQAASIEEQIAGVERAIAARTTRPKPKPRKVPQEAKDLAVQLCKYNRGLMRYRYNHTKQRVIMVQCIDGSYIQHFRL